MPDFPDTPPQVLGTPDPVTPEPRPQVLPDPYDCPEDSVAGAFERLNVALSDLQREILILALGDMIRVTRVLRRVLGPLVRWLSYRR